MLLSRNQHLLNDDRLRRLGRDTKQSNVFNCSKAETENDLDLKHPIKSFGGQINLSRFKIEFKRYNNYLAG